MAYINGKETFFSPLQIGGNDVKLQGVKTVQITENGEHEIATDSGYDGMVKVVANVNVPTESEEPTLQEKTVTENGEVTADSGYDGLSKVTVNVPSEEPTLQEKTVTENGEVTADSGYDGLSKVTVNVPSEEPTLEEITILENGEYTPSGDGFSKVTVSVPTGTDTSDATATADKVIKGETFYGADGKKTGTMPSVTENTPTLTLEGDGSGNVAIKHTQMFNTYLPAGETELGTVAVENLAVGNIKNGVTILGITGEYEGETNSALPIEVSTEAEMTALLESGEVGGVYKYVGTTGTYESGALYVLEVSE